jgi:hypothetical protein
MGDFVEGYDYRRRFEKKIKLKQQNGRCYWCGRRLKVYKKFPFIRNKKGGIPFLYYPPDAATVDHIYAISDERRNAFKEREVPSPYVLACYVCNNERGGRLVEDQETLFGKPHVQWETL